jgi:Tol biopolymer transport system component
MSSRFHGDRRRQPRWRCFIQLGLLHFGLVGLVGPGSVGATEVSLVSFEPFLAGEAGNGVTVPGRIRVGGNWHIANSTASNLGPWIDLNAASDAFVFDSQSSSWELISRKFGRPGHTASGSSAACCVSADDRFVLFSSRANDVVAGSAGTPNPDVTQTYLFDRNLGTSLLLSHRPGLPETGGNLSSFPVALSQDGRYAVFRSQATDLGAGSGNNPGCLFLFDRGTGEIRLIDHVAGSPLAYASSGSTGLEFSADGRYFVFSSNAADLIAGVADGNNAQDVFLYDVATDSLSLVSADPTDGMVAVGGAANDFAAGGRYLLVSSGARLVANMSDGNTAVGDDCFLWDRQTRLFRLISHDHAAPSFTGNLGSICGRLSADGLYSYFWSRAGNLIPGFVPPVPLSDSLYVFDNSTGANTLVTHLAANPSQGASGGTSFPQEVSSDGRHLLYSSFSTGLDAGASDLNAASDLYLYDRQNNSSTLVSRQGSDAVAGGGDPFGEIGDSGTVFFSSQSPLDPEAPDTNRDYDLYRFDPATATTYLLSATRSAGKRAVGDATSWRISADGRWALWGSHLYDSRRFQNELVAHQAGSPSTPANGTSYAWNIDAAGRYVLLMSAATDLASVTDGNAGIDVYRYDRETQNALLISHEDESPSVAAETASEAAWLSADGRRALFASSAGNLAAGGSAGFRNLYLWKEDDPDLERISHPHLQNNLPADGNTYFDSISEDERFLLFHSTAANLVPSFVDGNGSFQDAYLYDRATALTHLVNHQPGAGNVGLAGTVGSILPTGDWSFIYFSVSNSNPATTQFYRLNRSTSETAQLLSIGPCPFLNSPLEGISPDGRFLLFSSSCPMVAGDTNGGFDSYLYDRILGQFVLITHLPGNPAVAGAGGFSNTGMSQDGRYVFYKGLNTHGEAYRYDRTTSAAKRLLPAFDDPQQNLRVQSPTASRDGSFVVLGSASPAAALYDANTTNDVFLVDLADFFADGFESGNTAAWSLTVP